MIFGWMRYLLQYFTSAKVTAIQLKQVSTVERRHWSLTEVTGWYQNDEKLLKITRCIRPLIRERLDLSVHVFKRSNTSQLSCIHSPLSFCRRNRETEDDLKATETLLKLVRWTAVFEGEPFLCWTVNIEFFEMALFADGFKKSRDTIRSGRKYFRMVCFASRLMFEWYSLLCERSVR